MDTPPLLRLRLRDGTPIGVRPVTPEDAPRLTRGFRALSSETRRFRFLTPIAQLSDEQARYLTEVDQYDHVAWGATPLLDPEADGFGVARMVRLPGEPSVAEFSITVVDEVQGHGMGSLFLALLALLAPPRGIDTLRAYVASDNTRMTNWMRSLGAATTDMAGDLTFDLSTHPPRLPVRFARKMRRIQEEAEQQGVSFDPPGAV